MDVVADWAERIRTAHAAGTRLAIRGGGSKVSLAPVVPQAPPLSTRDLQGVLDYEPTELVVSACTGTSLTELAALLAANGQRLPFEPPHFGDAATVGGMVACGYAGPARPWCGNVRDAVLGVRMLNGLGEDLRFGGKVMKNVAGYDLARLQVGAYGRLGVLCEVSIKVLPAAEEETTLRLALPKQIALETVVALQRKAVPLTGTFHLAAPGESSNVLYLRLAGNSGGVAYWRQTIGGDVLSVAQATLLWTSVREHQHEFFRSPGELWRWHLPANAAYPEDASMAGDWCTEWGGALRWLRAGLPLDAAVVDATARRLGGYARRWRPFRLPIANSVRAALETRIAAAFDPAGVFAPAND